MTLDDSARLAELDAHGTRAVLAAFPTQCREALALQPAPALTLRRPRLVVVAAMGGSAAGGDLLAACAADHLDVPVLVHRGYGLPTLAGERDLVIASSYSGETVEVLSAAETALARGCTLVAVTAGGPLGALAAARSLPRVSLPTGLMPRMALGYLLFPLMTTLREADLAVVKDEEVDEALAVLQTLAEELDVSEPTARNAAKLLALGMGGRLPVIYGGPGTGSAAYRWKTDFEENAKLFAASGVLPEMNHNEIEAWRTARAADLHLVLLREQGEIPDITRRFALLRELVDGAAGGVSEAWARGESTLARILSLVYLGQWTSYYLALLAGVDPWPVPTLDALKARLRERE
jgi:glucose/mannose-6-phosphate isomerase